MWEIETLTVAMLRVPKLSDDHVVGNNEDGIEDFKSILKQSLKMLLK